MPARRSVDHHRSEAPCSLEHHRPSRIDDVGKGVGASVPQVPACHTDPIGAPGGGTGQPSAGAWWMAGLGTLAVVGGFGPLDQMQTGAPRALLFGTRAGFAFALEARLSCPPLWGLDLALLGAVLLSTAPPPVGPVPVIEASRRA
jgi:hypothetical protein